jgi:phenylacetate-CoA ligase
MHKPVDSLGRPFWNVTSETLSTERIQTIQERRLGRLLRHVARNSRFYRNKFGKNDFDALPLLTRTQFAQLPLTTKDEVRSDQAAALADGRLPYANLLCVPLDEIRVERTTSGTTGVPVIIPLTEAEMDDSSLVLGEIALRGFSAAGVTPADIMLYCWGMGGMTVGGAGNFLPLGGQPRTFFALVPGHTGKSRLHVETVRDIGISLLFATPSYIRYLAELARSMGYDPHKDFPVRKVFVSGEAGPTTIPAIREEVEATWGADCYDVWGQLESRTRAFECGVRNGLHIAEDIHLYEVLKPDTLEPAGPGETGVLVVTYLLADAAPILRYDTRDLVQVTDEPCACGRTGRRIMSILGRADDMVRVRGRQFLPAEVLRFVLRLPGVNGAARILLDRDSLGKDRFVVQVEAVPTAQQSEGLEECVRREVIESVGLDPEVEVFAEGALGRSMLKTPPVLDLRDPTQRERYQAAMANVKAF